VQVLALNAILLLVRLAAVVRDQRERGTGGCVGSGLSHGVYRKIEVTDADVSARAGRRQERTGRAHARARRVLELGAARQAEAGDGDGLRRLERLDQRVGGVGQARRECHGAGDGQVRDLDGLARTSRHQVSGGDGVVLTSRAQPPGSRNVASARLDFAAAGSAAATANSTDRQPRDSQHPDRDGLHAAGSPDLVCAANK